MLQDPIPPQRQKKIRKKRNLPGNPDPDAEVVALSPNTLLATNRYVCEVCNKGFLRDQNLQLHRRGHNLPWKLKQRSNSSKETRKRAYVCPEPTCLHHHPSRALGDLTGIKKHYSRKHGEKKWKCGKCSKIYAVQSDWKAHSRTCGRREHRCDCGTLFTRKDSFITHRSFCDALAQESARLCATTTIFPANPPLPPPQVAPSLTSGSHLLSQGWVPQRLYQQDRNLMCSPFGNLHVSTSQPLSPTALLQKVTTSTMHVSSAWGNGTVGLTRDFIGLAETDPYGCGNGNGNVIRDMLTYTQGMELFAMHDLQHVDFGFTETSLNLDNGRKFEFT